MPDVSPAHGLGPHVVGLRVVVRRVLRGQRGPSGGTAMTDVLGICTAWSEGVCVVRPESGDEVRIAIGDIVSGKPVPPRPTPRLRVGPAEAQRRAMSLFPDLRTVPLGAWTLRHCPGHPARRANSVLAMTDPGLAEEAAYDGVLDFYTARDARPIAAVLPGSPSEEIFLARGWVPESQDADTVFQLTSVASLARAIGDLEPGGGPQVLVEAEGDLARVVIGAEAGGDVWASGVAALDGDWVGYRSILVDPVRRRRGLGLAVMAALAEWSAEEGALTAYLQVLGDNEPALALYDRLGFVEHHRYRYLAVPLAAAHSGAD